MVSEDTRAVATHAGFHHVTLNVSDVERSVRWYQDVLGFEPVTSYQSDTFYRAILRHPSSGAVLGLTRHDAAVASARFDERRSGLDHLALETVDHDQLQAWLDHLDAFDVPHSGIKAGALPGSALITFRDPDGLQLEIFAPAGPR